MSSTTPFAATPPAATVYVPVSVLFVVPASVEVGAIVPLPAPSAEFETATVCVPPPTPTVVRVPALVDFSLTVNV